MRRRDELKKKKLVEKEVRRKCYKELGCILHSKAQRNKMRKKNSSDFFTTSIPTAFAQELSRYWGCSYIVSELFNMSYKILLQIYYILMQHYSIVTYVSKYTMCTYGVNAPLSCCAAAM